MSLIEKAERVEDPAYLAWCRLEPCEFWDLPSAEPHGGGEAHHTLPKRMGGANLRDDLAVPICRRCHMRCEGLTVVVNGARLGPIAKDEQLRRAERARLRYLVETRSGEPVIKVPW